MLKLFLVAALVCLLQAASVVSAAGQDFASLVSQAGSLNQQWLNQIDTASKATDAASAQAESATAVATGKQVQALLQQALTIAPDDASRSRVQGLLGHVNAALQDVQGVSTANDLSTIQSALNAERGEVNEALNEIVPFAGTQPATTASAAPSTTAASAPTLPATGGMPVGLVLAGAALLIGLGERLRRAAA